MIRLKPRAYVIDDDRAFNELLLVILGKFGIDVEKFQEPSALLARVKIQPPDLCIIDLNLGSALQGFELITKLREITHAKVPLMIASSSSDIPTITHAVEMGANDYLLKPLNREVLASKLTNFFSTQELEYSKPAASKTQQTDIETALILNSDVVEIDETGLSVLSPHLILKGTVVNVSSQLLQEITGRERPLLLTVVSVAIDPKRNAYLTYMEFEHSDEALILNVRAWITNRMLG
jgi:DNA-binding response OmpR family regulator